MFRKSLPELSNLQIDRYYRNQVRYGGCYSKDKIPHVIGNKFYFINLQSSTQGSGTHWTLLYNCSDPTVTYFDSMGEVPPKSVQSVMNATHKKQEYNTFDLQPINSSSCGWWCIYVAGKLLSGGTLDGIVNSFKHLTIAHNDEVLKHHFSSTHL